MLSTSDVDFVALVIEKTKSGALKWGPIADVSSYEETFAAIPAGQSLWLRRFPRDHAAPLVSLSLERISGTVAHEINNGTLPLEDLWEAVQVQGETEVEKAIAALRKLADPSIRPKPVRTRPFGPASRGWLGWLLGR